MSGHHDEGHQHAYTREPNALMKGSALRLVEVPPALVDELRDLVFEQEMQRREKQGPSDYEKWYRRYSNVKDQGRRVIAWKTNKPFVPENIFFRSCDTSRLLPMNCAAFRVQFYALRQHWDFIDTKGSQAQYVQHIVLSLMHELLLLRNVHDYAGADIPIICLNWDVSLVEAAMDYWVECSKNEWTETERDNEYCRIATKVASSGASPCMYQVDRCVRALLSDPGVGYVAPVIGFFQHIKEGKCLPLFMRPAHMLPHLAELPTGCTAPECNDPNCGYWNMKAARCLQYPSPMIRMPNRKEDRIVCNLWGCEVQHTPSTEHQQCTKCKEVVYCGREHQTRDWHAHKRVCEKNAP